jgi:hypothetical protein
MAVCAADTFSSAVADGVAGCAAGCASRRVADCEAGFVLGSLAGGVVDDEGAVICELQRRRSRFTKKSRMIGKPSVNGSSNRFFMKFERCSKRSCNTSAAACF